MNDENRGDMHNVHMNDEGGGGGGGGETHTQKRRRSAVQGIGEEALKEARTDDELMEVVDAMLVLRARAGDKHVVMHGIDTVIAKAVCRAVDARGRCLQRVLSQMESFPPRVLAAVRNHVLALDVSGADASAAAFQLMPALMRPGIHVGVRELGPGTIAEGCADGGEEVESTHQQQQHQHQQQQQQLGVMTNDDVLEAWMSKTWAPHVVAEMLEELRSCPLSKAWIRVVLNKAIATCTAVGANLNEVPSVAYQLLLLSRIDLKQEILAGIIELVEKLRTSRVSGAEREQLRHVEETIVLHIGFFVKQDPFVAAQWLKLLKNDNTKTLSCFEMSLVLSFARIQRFEPQCLNYIFDSFCDANVADVTVATSAWLSSVMVPALGADSASSSSSSSFQCLGDALFEFIRRSSGGMEHGVPSLVALAFHFMARISSQSLLQAFLRIARNADAANLRSNRRNTSLARAVHVGVDIAVAAFQQHESLRAEIVARALRNVMGASSAMEAAPSTFLIARLCRRGSPTDLLPFVFKIKEALEYSTTLPPDAALALLAALQPLLRLRLDLVDTIVLVLRKAIFSSDPRARVTAVRGFTLLILSESGAAVNGGGGAPGSDGGEASCSQRPHINENISSSVLLDDFLGFARRCLTLRQREVRKAVYSSFVELIEADPTVCSRLADVLVEHVRDFIDDRGEQDSPLRLERCFSHGTVGQGHGLVPEAVDASSRTVVEPIDELLACVLAVANASTDDTEAQRQLGDILADISSRLQLCDPKALNLDGGGGGSGGGGSISSDDEIADRAKLLLGCLEVSMSAAMCKGRKSAFAAAEDDGNVKVQETPTVTELELRPLWSLHVLLSSLAQNKSKAARAASRLGKRKATDPASTAATVAPTSVADATQVGGGGAPTPTKLIQDVRRPLLSAEVLKECIKACMPTTPASSTTTTAGASEPPNEKFIGFVLQACLDALEFMRKTAFSMDCSIDVLQSGGVASHAASNSSGGSMRTAGPVVILSSDVPAWNVLSRRARRGMERIAPVLMQLCSKCLLTESPARAKADKKRSKSDDYEQLAVRCIEEVSKLASVQSFGSPAIGGVTAIAAELVSVVEVLVTKGAFSSADVILRAVHDMLMEDTNAAARDAAIANLGTRLLTMCGLRVDHANASRSLVRLMLWTQPLSKSSETALRLVREANEVQSMMDDDEDDHAAHCDDDEEPVQRSARFLFISSKTCATVKRTVLEYILDALGECEWLHSQLRHAHVRATPPNSALDAPRAVPGRKNDEVVVFKSALERMSALARILDECLKSHYAEETKSSEALVRAATRFFKLLAMYTKSQIAPKGFVQRPPSRQYALLVDLSVQNITPHVYESFMPTAGFSGRLKKEAQQIPDLVFAIEQTETLLIQLGNAAKVNYLKNAKRSTARDFKIGNA